MEEILMGGKFAWVPRSEKLTLKDWLLGIAGAFLEIGLIALILIIISWGVMLLEWLGLD